MASQQLWWLAPTLTLVTIGLVVWFNWGQDKVRVWRMRRGIEVHLTLAPEKKEQSWCYELDVPPHTQIAI